MLAVAVMAAACTPRVVDPPTSVAATTANACNEVTLVQVYQNAGANFSIVQRVEDKARWIVEGKLGEPGETFRVC